MSDVSYILIHSLWSPFSCRAQEEELSRGSIATAQRLGVEPLPFVLAVLFGANMSFATPFGYQTNLLILSAGGYKFSDFLRVGVPLAIIMWLGFSIVLPLLYDLG